MKLGPYLKEQRESRNITLRQIEESVGISNAYLSQLENNKITNPSPVILHKLSDYLNVSYAFLMQLAGYPVPTISSERSGLVLSARAENTLNNITVEEEEKLSEYLRFLRSSRKHKK